MDADWTAVAISAVVVAGGIALNLFIVGRLVGQWGEALKTVTTNLKDVADDVEKLSGDGEAVAVQVRLLDARVKVTEAAADKFWEMRDAFIRMTTTIEVEGKQQRERLDSLARGQSVIERQLANIVTAQRGGLTVLKTDDH